MNSLLIYLFWPNPANATYTSPKALVLLIVCGLLLVASAAIRLWRKRVGSGILRKLTRSWATAALSFGVTGFVMVVARAEQIQYLSMRFLWVVWCVPAFLYIVLQVRLFRARYYEVLPTVMADDPLHKYLPGQRRP